MSRRRKTVQHPLAQHGVVRARNEDARIAPDALLVNESESPLAWLARRKDASGKPMIDAAQFAAGERLRADFTRAAMTPRIGANLTSPVAHDRRGGGENAVHYSDLVIAAKERLNRALDAVGPEFSGLLLDVCCFLKGLETVEHERGWPRRTSKIVLGLALDRLARHYGIAAKISGRHRAPIRNWQAADARPTMDAYRD
ncbi:MAG: DNA replication protein [Xanthobacteraceae bacterium]|nr:DNA replication protein [Xanthobacteraceae bacterium]